jgi:hypothetical protein
MPPKANPNRPTPVDQSLDISDLLEAIYGVDDEFQLTLTGKTKTVELPDDRTIILSPGLKATLTNLDTGESVTVSATGSFHEEILPDGTVVTVATGRNILFDPFINNGGPGLVLATGRFTFAVDGDGDLVQPLEGKGQVIDLIDLL